MMIRIAILWYLIGLLLFYTVATFDVQSYNNWGYFYYGWQKLCDILFIVTILLRPKSSQVIQPVLYIAFARFLWEIISFSCGFQSTTPIIVGSLFIILIIVCLFITIKEITRWRRLKY